MVMKMMVIGTSRFHSILSWWSFSFLCLAYNFTISQKIVTSCSFFFFFKKKKSLLLACPTHTNPPGSGLGTGGILFDKHTDKSIQQVN